MGPFLLTLAGCGAGDPLTPASPEPFLYLVLSTARPAALPQPDSLLSAVLMTTGTPLRSEYRTAEQFAMRRVSDGASFAWSARGLTGPAPATYQFVTLAGAGNYLLADTAGAAGLGRQDLAPGETYTLRIDTDGRTVEGRVTVPGRPVPSLVRRGDRTFAVWPRTAGAAAYLVDGETEGRGAVVLTDTAYVLLYDRRDGTPANPAVRVTALDANLFRYMSDSTLERAGLTGGYGVFGAVSTGVLLVPVRP